MVKAVSTKNTRKLAGRGGKDTEAYNPYIFGKSSKCLHIIVESPCSLSSAPATNF
uniref:Uncharacterized protein n=1 Tax=Colobus angolensis palliatus TaxID=336983 RepID=A0A2K5KBQ5_COLAP